LSPLFGEMPSEPRRRAGTRGGLLGIVSFSNRTRSTSASRSIGRAYYDAAVTRRAEEGADTLTASVDPARTTEASDTSGALLAGRYRVLELLGSGGMGTVYKVLDTELEEIVALKTLRRELMDAPGAVERFRREVKLARKVTHRSIARVFDTGEHEREKFLTMEFVAGRSLGRMLSERGPLPPAEVVAIGGAIAEGLAAAHAAGVVHRDLKPDNILLEDGGRVVITDFGVARAITMTDARATSAGGIVGTPAYMAPEQVEGSDIDGRTDLYALGIVLFEMLSGALPFDGETPLSIAAARLVRPPRDLARLRPDLPSALVDVVRRAMARSPADRFATAEALGGALAASVTTMSMTRAPSVPPPRKEERRIAVLPIRAGKPDDAWMADGLAEDLGDALSMLQGVRVRSRAGAPAEGEDVRAFGRRNEVEALVEGTLRRDGERFRASLRLVSVEDGFQIWAHRFEGSTGDLLRVSDEAARAIAGALSGVVASAEARPAPSAEAVELYLRARQARLTFIGSPIAVELLERAATLAPNDPTILAACAIAAAHEVFRPNASPGVMARARAAADRAVLLAPHLPDPHLALARVRLADQDDASAIRSAMRAKQYGPSMADADDLIGRILAERDMDDVAKGHLERALWIDPSLLFPRIDLARLAALAGRYDEADRLLSELRSRSPQHHALIASRLAMWSGRLEWVEDYTTFSNPAITVFHERTVQAIRTRKLDDDAWRSMEVIIEGVPPVSRPRRLFRQMECELRSFVGDVDAAELALAKAVDAGLTDVPWIRRCPLIEPLRARPSFAEHATTVAARSRPAAEAYAAGVAATGVI
jgi:TolB-like protein/tRNA A-37 threonylcarbamoyl transferase component Bud32